jgi:hypothetical protein
MKKPILLLALISILYSTVTIADYKINITSHVLNQNTTFGEVVPSLPDLVPFDETGDFGNIALIGSNGITASSITSNAVSFSTNGSFPFTALFDGYQFGTMIYGIKINSSSAGEIGYGYFNSSAGTSTNRYFSVDLGREASISGFRFLGYRASARSYIPKDVRIESSVDGTDGSFTTEESFTLSRVSDSGVIPMSTPFTSRYFRFYVENGYNATYLIFGEIEVFQTQP